MTEETSTAAADIAAVDITMDVDVSVIEAPVDGDVPATDNTATVEGQEGFIFNLENYWPHGLRNAEALSENVELLHVYTRDHVRTLECRFCAPTASSPVPTCSYIELQPKMRYANRKVMKEVKFEDHPRAYEEFCEQVDPKDREFIVSSQILRPGCCEQDCLAVTLIQEKEIQFTSLFRYFYQNKKILVYLRLDSEAIPLIPELLNTVNFSETLRSSYLGGFSRTTKNLDVVSDALEFEKATIPEGFGLELRDDQARTVKWMQSLESVEPLEANTIRHSVSNWKTSSFNSDLRIKLGHSPYYVNFDVRNENKISESPMVDPQTIQSVRLRSGILADDTGSGKTITTLGLIYSSPFGEESERERAKHYVNDANNFVLPGRGSLILCPENIQKQWMEEAVRCNPNFKVISFAKNEDKVTLSWASVMEADLVVASYGFLGKSYEFVPKAQVVSDIQATGNVQLHKIHFHRLILDEFHELAQQSLELNAQIRKIRADHVWGLTGTPNYTHLPSLLCHFRLPVAVEAAVYDNVHGYNEFFRKFTKRNIPDLNLPPIETETVWVNMTRSEHFVHSVNSERASRRTRLMICSHYQLVDKAASSQQTFRTIKQIEQMMVKDRADAVLAFQTKLSANDLAAATLQIEIETATALLNQITIPVTGAMAMPNDVVDISNGQFPVMTNEQAPVMTNEQLPATNNGPSMINQHLINQHIIDQRAIEAKRFEARIRTLTCEINNIFNESESIKKKLNEDQRKLNYYESVFKAINDPSGNNCLICYDKIENDSLAVLPCSHLFCYDCILMAVREGKMGHTCPLCRDNFKSKEKIYRISFSTAGDEATMPDKYAHLDTSKYSSKLIALYRYVSDLFDAEPGSKIILFLQYGDLAQFISQTLNELKMNHVRVTGDIDQRQNAITQFRESPDVRLIMLSSEDSVSGINLTQATHVILLHPFYSDKGEHIDLAYEKQGISRAYRFGLQHPLKIVRFAVKGTIEEEITLRRQNVRL